MSKDLIWQNKERFPIASSDINEVVNFGVQLSKREKSQIIGGFERRDFEMVTNFVWSKAIFILKSTLASMGKEFLSELLDRPEIDETTNIYQAVSEFEAIRLAEELGIVSGTGVVRLKNALNLATHFISTDENEDLDKVMTQEEALMVIKPCFQSILAYDKVDAALDFKNFRDSLSNETLHGSNPSINKLTHSPYFFKRTTIRVLLSIVKSSSGAQLENSLANANLIIPLIWSDLQVPEKWQLGRVYAELNSDGKTKAVSGLRQVLLKVKGFDFVPEDLRSNSFIRVASEILNAHTSINNFYNEPSPVNMLAQMGSVIPIPALPKAMSAILSVKLGNSYGTSWAAQAPADIILNNISPERWEYFFINCLSNDDIVLNKLRQRGLAARWIEIVGSKVDFDDLASKAKEKHLAALIRATRDKRIDKINAEALNLIQKIGYAE